MPNQARQEESVCPKHVEQVKQNSEAKGDLVFATGDNWAGNNATDSVIMAAEPDSWFDAGLMR